MKAVSALASLLMISCATVHPNPAKILVGEWRYADQIQACHYVFTPDHTFKGEVVYRGRIISKFKGRWSIEGDALHYTYLSDELGRIPVGATDRDKLLNVEPGSFVIEALDGKRRKYVRIR